MAIYFKFRSAKESDSVSIDGPSITVANLRSLIWAKKKPTNGTDYDYVISNAQSGEAYVDLDCLIPRYSSVIVRRVPRPSLPIVLKQDVDVLRTPHAEKLSARQDETDDFGDVYAGPKVDRAEHLPSKDALTPLFGSLGVPTVGVSRLRNPTRSVPNGSAPRPTVSTRRGPADFYKPASYGLQSKDIPHQGYICRRCGIPGHFIKDCLTNGDPAFDKKLMKKPLGIPKTMLVPDEQGTYFLPSGEVVVCKPNELAFEKAMACVPVSRSKSSIPLDLCCGLCQGAFVDAVICSKCCFQSFCYKCIESQLDSKSQCECGSRNVFVESLLPNRALRQAAERLLQSTPNTLGDSSGNTSGVTNLSSERSSSENGRTTSKRQLPELHRNGLQVSKRYNLGSSTGWGRAT